MSTDAARAAQELGGAAGQGAREGDGKLAAELAAVERARAKLVADMEVLDREVRLEVLYRMENLAWKAVAGLSAAVAGLAATKVLNLVWGRIRPGGNAPPTDPTDPRTRTSDALIWTALTGMGVGVAAVIAQRQAAKGWTKATGHVPPAFAKDDDED